MRLPPSILLALTLLLAGPAGSAAAPGRWTVDDLVHAERAGSWDLAPDGSLAVWVKTTVETVEGKEQAVDNLWLTPLSAEAESRQLTRGTASISGPEISPDGRHVAFLTDREPPKPGRGDGERGKHQVWVLPLRGGEAYPVSGFEQSVRAFAWTGPESLVLAVPEAPSAVERERKEEKDTSVVVEDEETAPVRLFSQTLDGEVKRLIDNDGWIDALAVSPDGRRAVVTAQQSLSYEFDSRVPPDSFLVDLATGEMTKLELAGPGPDGLEGETRRLVPFAVRWALDGSGFYFADAYSSHPLYRTASILRLYVYDLSAARPVPVDLGWERGLGGDFEPTPDGFIALLADGVRFRPARYARTGDGWTRTWLTGTHAGNLDGWALADDGETLVYEHSSATKPPQWFAAELGGERILGERQVTKLNPSFADKPTGRVEVIQWTGALGDTVEGLLHYPLDWREGDGPRPLLLDIHGGPAGADRDSWDQRWAGPNVLWRQRGAFVLQANYHGSAAYGLDWVESIRERYYELEIPDLEAGVDQLIERGLADPERLGTVGWSNGGILSAELITRTHRYKAASIGAADVEWISDWGNVDFGASFDNYYFGAPPWEAPEVYVEKSPFFRLTEVTTPTLVHTGTEDRNVPPHQSWSLFRALQQIGRAPVKLVLYPGEPHGLRQVAHQRRKVEEDLAWFDRHLFGTTDEANPAVRPGSPIAARLALAGAARVGGAVGVTTGGVLVPELVPFGGERVGRFEVTRAQWAAFRPESEPAPGTENLPATGVSFEDARAYVAWLTETTGEPYRLPTAAEMKGWAKKAGGGRLPARRSTRTARIGVASSKS